MNLPTATLAACIVILAALAFPHIRPLLPVLWSRRPRRYRPRHRAFVSRRMVFALPVRVVAAS